MEPLDRLESQRALEARARARLFERYPTHFYPHPGEHAPEEVRPGGEHEAGTRLGPGALATVDRYLFESWIAREARTIARDHGDPLDAARAAVHRVRSLVVTERELRGLESHASMDAPSSLEERAYATLALGFMNDEGINYVVGCVLRAMGFAVSPFETRPVAGDPHVLLLLHHEERGAFVDAWSDVSVMWVEGFDAARACADREPGHAPPVIGGPLEGAPLYLEVSGPGGDYSRRGLHSRDTFLSGVLRDDRPLAGRDPSSLRDAVEAFCEEAAAVEGEPSTETWRAYLELRARHIEGLLSQPSEPYEALLEDERLKGATRRLVRALSVRADPSAAARRPAAIRAGAPCRPASDLETRMRAGDVSAWARWDPRPIADEDMKAAWTEVFSKRGRPGVPDMVRAYTHFAYCVASCNFCMYWHEVPKSQDAYARYVSYLVSRVRWHLDAFGRQPIAAAYFGGGTPTATPRGELARYLEAFTAAFDVRGEFTVEGHPGTTELEDIELLADHGVNRLSMGLQSLEHEVLVRITRRNAPLEALHELVAAARDRSIIVNLDLILGLPGQSLESFRADVERVMELGPDYLTMYLYEPVQRLPQRPSADMTYERALTDALLSRINELGYEVGDRLGPKRRSVRLRRRGAREFIGHDEYSQFDEMPSHTLALGPGAYGHVFGRYWYREATAMSRLDEGRGRYLGTPVTPVDECRSVVLDALERGERFSPAQIERVTGIDVRRAFSDAFALAAQKGIFRSLDGDRMVAVQGQEGREAFIDQIAPKPPRRALRVLEDPGFNPALATLRAGEEGDDVDPADRAALDELSETLRVPTRGYQICRNVWVGRRSGSTLEFHVGAPKVEPLAIQVFAPHSPRKRFFTTDRFAIAYRTASGEPPNQLERRFLAWLRARLIALPTAAAVAASRPAGRG